MSFDRASEKPVTRSAVYYHKLCDLPDIELFEFPCHGFYIERTRVVQQIDPFSVYPYEFFYLIRPIRGILGFLQYYPRRNHGFSRYVIRCNYRKFCTLRLYKNYRKSLV